MRGRFTAVAVLLALVLVAAMLVGCGGTSDKKTTDDKEVGNITGESKTVKVGEDMTIELETNPSTGYDWKVTTEPDPAILKLNGDSIETGSTLPGAPSTHVFRYKALKAGKTTIVYDYVRSWETDQPPVKTHTVAVEVTE
ncbi:MAG: protease inhibitor I42 family protein [Actinobacteria bacterium]|nr:protease inhibitor I42 family protein [Actinomycetota bacterium]MBU1945020.1 protease inhibitor I42 family protein [Actinomycetota bacterium]MBU2686644.1 protease inhibitor I42 family protein [Actinomycetota bacterium]